MPRCPIKYNQTVEERFLDLLVKKEKKIKIDERDLIDLIQCYMRVRKTDNKVIHSKADSIVDTIAKKYGYCT